MSLPQRVAVAAQVLLDSSRALISDIDNVVWSTELYQGLTSTIKTSLALIGKAYNASLPINRLPPELLGLIFSHIRSPALPAMTDSYQAYPCPFDSYESLISATQVCSRWRTIALWKGSLWTEVDRLAFGRGGLADVILQRSAAALLHLRCNNCQDEWDEVFQLIRTNGTRLHKLDVGGRYCWVRAASKVWALFSVDMPLLRSLRVVLSPINTMSDTLAVVSYKTLPALTALMLDNCICIPTAPIPNLTHLYIDYPGNIGASTLLSFLCSTPSLKVLEIIHGTCIDDSAQTAPIPTLSRLRHLNIHNTGNSMQSSSPISKILVPNLVTVSLTSGYLDGDTIPPWPLPQSFPRNFSQMSLLVREFVPSLEFHTTLEGNHYGLKFTTDRGPTIDQSWPKTASDLFKLSNITTLHVHHGESGNFLGWQIFVHIAAYLPQLATLFLDARTPYEDPDYHWDALKALETFLASDQPILCPNLLSLTVHMNTFWTPRDLCRSLAPALAKRTRAGLRLQTLRVCENQVEVGKLGLDALSEYVDNVEFIEGPLWIPDEGGIWADNNDDWKR